jgi:putative FmdB family regulatory protein
MPIYEYKCKKGHRFDVMQSFSDDPVASCEVCGASVEKVMHSPAIHFKGKGFYSTDYGSRKRSRELKDAAEGTGKHAKDGDGASSNGSSESSSKESKDSKDKPKTESAKASSPASKSD